MNKIIIYILISILLILCFMPIKLKITYNKKIDIDVIFIILFNYRFDIDEFIKKIAIDKNDNISLTLLLENIKHMKNALGKNKKLIYKIINNTVIEEFKIEIFNNLDKIYDLITIKYFIGVIAKILEESFKVIKQSNITIKIKDENEIKGLIVFRIYIFVLIKIFIYEVILKIKNKVIKKRGKNNESSYQRTI